MNPMLAVVGFWIAFIFLVLGYIFRKKKLRDMFYQVSMATAFISVVIFIWWAVLRAIGAI